MTTAAAEPTMSDAELARLVVPTPPPEFSLTRLSNREREAFWMIVRGASSREMATEMKVSVKTVETHRSHINRKLGVTSPLDLLRKALISGVVRVSDLTA